MKSIAFALQTAWVFLLVTVLWLLGVKPNDIEMEEEWP